MSISITMEELLNWTDHERARWREWLGADADRLDIPCQREGRLTTVWSVLDHIFLVERRHLARLEGGLPPESTGVKHGDVEALFDYADLVRADFREYLAEMDGEDAAEILTFQVSSGPLVTSKRKLALHVVMHEVRHMAQVALAVRLAGHEPPGRHDLAFLPAMT
ncbi:MAG: hypothetical protein HOP14_01460 [Acidobacteria bacterium]|nr:hypothetical protein [Acidobacteriota bacterium]